MGVPRRLRSRLALGVAVALAGVTAAGAAVALVARGDGEEPRHAHRDSGAVNPHPVAGHFRPDGTELAECTPELPRCYEQAFGNIAFNEGPKRAMALFDERIREDRAVEAGCHRIAHTIGSAALARFDGDVPKAFAQGSSSCWSGYYHGILERAFTGVSSKEKLASVARTLCTDPGIRQTSFLLYQCVHGLGHGLMIYSGYNLPFSLEMCDRLATSWDQTSCTGGVFMENIASTYDVRSRWLRDDDLVYPCNAVAERHKLYCYLMVTSRVNEVNGYRWKETAAVCRTVERAWIETCFESYGRDASGFTRQNPAEAARICEFAASFAASCFYGAARDMTSNYANGRRASELCRLAGGTSRERCFYGIGTILGNIEPTGARRRAACMDVTPRRLLVHCLAGARAPGPGVLESPA